MKTSCDGARDPLPRWARLSWRRSFGGRNSRLRCCSQRRASGKSAQGICRSFPFSNSKFHRSPRSSYRAPPRRALLFAAPSGSYARPEVRKLPGPVPIIDRSNWFQGKAAGRKVVFPAGPRRTWMAAPRRSRRKANGLIPPGGDPWGVSRKKVPHPKIRSRRRKLNPSVRRHDKHRLESRSRIWGGFGLVWDLVEG